MSQFTLKIAGREHVVACRDGEEPHLLALADRLNANAELALRASGGQTGERTMLFLALLLADQLIEAERAPAPPPVPAAAPEIPPGALDRLADRLERLALLLENGHEHA